MALEYCFSYPSLFITCIVNPKWEEITYTLLANNDAIYISSVFAIIFYLKLTQLLKDLKE